MRLIDALQTHRIRLGEQGIHAWLSAAVAAWPPAVDTHLAHRPVEV